MLQIGRMAIYLLLCLAAALATAAGAAPPITLVHVHGLAYSPDGSRILIPSHHGLAIYSDGKWTKAPGPQHDYMGFVATGEFMYSSGHPAPGSGLVNPFGVIRSGDGGRSWTNLGLEGETDFHLLAAGYHTNAIYVFNPAPNSRMKATGLHVTVNDGFTWKHAPAAGLAGEPATLAVHPADPDIVAVGTRDGLFLSEDGGARFLRVAVGQTLAAFFDLDGTHLWHGGYDGDATLYRLDRAGGDARAVALPPLPGDAVAYIAQNPIRLDEYAIATFKRNVFMSRDAGATWVEIAREGQTRDAAQ